LKKGGKGSVAKLKKEKTLKIQFERKGRNLTNPIIATLDGYWSKKKRSGTTPFDRRGGEALTHRVEEGRQTKQREKIK